MDDVEEIKAMLAEKREKYWANKWYSVLGRLEREFPPGFVVDAVNAYLQEGIVPDDPRILDVGQRIEYWRKLQAEAEAKRTEIKVRKWARAGR